MSAQPTSYYIASKAKAIAEQTAKARRALAEQFAKESPQWGLKPEEWEKRITCRTSECRSYVLEECISLTSDPNLQAAGVEVCARTNVETSEVYTTLRPVHNEIVFRRPAPPKDAEETMKKVLVQQWEHLSELQEHQSVGSPEYEGTTRAMREVDKTLKQFPPIPPSFEEGKVACVHTAVGTLDSCELPSKEMVEKTFSTESRPVTLAPQEHFMALKSTVQGWTEMGWGAALRTRYEGRDPSEMPFGMNDLMHRQIIFALSQVAPKAVCDLLAGVFQEVERFSPIERLKRWDLYFDRYFSMGSVLKECPELTEYLFDVFVGNQPIVAGTNIGDETRAFIRRDLLNVGTLTPSLAAHFANDPNPYFRVNIAARPDIPPNTLLQLANDSWDNVLISLIENPHTPPEAMVRIATNLHDHHFVSRLLRRVSASTLERNEIEKILAQNTDDNVRYALATETSNPEILHTFSNDPNVKIRELVAKSPWATPKILDILSKDIVRNVRGMVAQHPLVAIETLHKLALDLGDPNYLVPDVVSALAIEQLKKRNIPLTPEESVRDRYFHPEIQP